jgi:hypothetical protein
MPEPPDPGGNSDTEGIGQRSLPSHIGTAPEGRHGSLPNPELGKTATSTCASFA